MDDQNAKRRETAANPEGCYFCPFRRFTHKTWGTPRIGCKLSYLIRPQEYSEYYLEHKLDGCPIEDDEGVNRG